MSEIRISLLHLALKPGAVAANIALVEQGVRAAVQRQAPIGRSPLSYAYPAISSLTSSVLIRLRAIQTNGPDTSASQPKPYDWQSGLACGTRQIG